MPPLGYKYLPGTYKNNKKRGPKPFPGTRRNRCDLRVPPPQPIIRPKTTYSKKRKTAVLMYLIHHRVAAARGFHEHEQRYLPVTRHREGMAALSIEQMLKRRDDWDGGAVIYRPPTFRDAENFWKIPHSTITHWWKRRAKYLPEAEIERVKNYNPIDGTIASTDAAQPDGSTSGDPQQAADPASNEPEPIEIDDSSDDSDATDDEDEDESPENESPENESGNLEGSIQADGTSAVDAETVGSAEANTDATENAQHSGDTTEPEDAEGEEDLEDPPEVQAAIFDLQRA